MTVLQPFVRDYLDEPVPEETLTHPPSWSSSNLYQLLPSTTIHSILLVRITCLAIFLHNLFPCPFWYTSSSGALHPVFHTFLHPISMQRSTKIVTKIFLYAELHVFCPIQCCQGDCNVMWCYRKCELIVVALWNRADRPLYFHAVVCSSFFFFLFFLT